MTANLRHTRETHTTRYTPTPYMRTQERPHNFYSKTWLPHPLPQPLPPDSSQKQHTHTPAPTHLSGTASRNALASRTRYISDLPRRPAAAEAAAMAAATPDRRLRLPPSLPPPPPLLPDGSPSGGSEMEHARHFRPPRSREPSSRGCSSSACGPRPVGTRWRHRGERMARVRR